MANKHLTIPCHPGRHFTWDGKIGVTFASDLPEHYSSRIWADAADVGFYVRSERTGEIRLFCRGQAIRNPEGEDVGEEYFSSDGIFVKVFNT